MPDSPVSRISASLMVLFVAGAVAGCHIPVLTSTPKIAPFALPESDWGRASDRLVIACHRLSQADRPELPEHLASFRILTPTSADSYEIPVESSVGRLGWSGMIGGYRVLPCAPLVYVVGLDGKHGFLGPRTDAPYQVLPVRIAPRLELLNGEVRVAEENPRFGDKGTDVVTGSLLCLALALHDPNGGGHSDWTPATLVSREDAHALASFVANHVELFTRPTRVLSRRLADQYERSARSDAWLDIRRIVYLGSHQTPGLDECLARLREDDRVLIQREVVDGASIAGERPWRLAQWEDRRDPASIRP